MRVDAVERGGGGEHLLREVRGDLFALALLPEDAQRVDLRRLVGVAVVRSDDEVVAARPRRNVVQVLVRLAGDVEAALPQQVLPEVNVEQPCHPLLPRLQFGERERHPGRHRLHEPDAQPREPVRDALQHERDERIYGRQPVLPDGVRHALRNLARADVDAHRHVQRLRLPVERVEVGVARRAPARLDAALDRAHRAVLLRPRHLLDGGCDAQDGERRNPSKASA